MGDEYAVDNLGLAHTGVAVAAEDSVEVGELLGRLTVFLVAAVGEEEDEVAFLAELRQIFGQHLGEGAEVRAAGVFGMEVGQTILAQLYTTNDADLQAVALKDLVGLEVGHLQAVVEGNVCADEGELCPGEHVAQGYHAAVPLVVAEG